MKCKYGKSSNDNQRWGLKIVKKARVMIVTYAFNPASWMEMVTLLLFEEGIFHLLVTNINTIQNEFIEEKTRQLSYTFHHCLHFCCLQKLERNVDLHFERGKELSIVTTFKKKICALHQMTCLRLKWTPTTLERSRINSLRAIMSFFDPITTTSSRRVGKKHRREIFDFRWEKLIFCQG